MKKLTVLIVLSFTLQVNAQYFTWEPPVPITDSSTDNTRAIIYQIGSPGGSHGMYVIWQKETDSSFSEICYRKIFPAGVQADSVLLSQPGVHFRNPVMMECINTQGIESCLFYETDQNGDFDIYYFQIDGWGNFSGPFPLATGAGNQQHLSVVHAVNSTEPMAWEDDNKVMGCFVIYGSNPLHFTQPVVIDSVGAHDPVVANINSAELYYLKEIGSQSVIYHAPAPAWDSIWQSPAVFYGQGDNEALRTGFSIWGDNTVFLAWQSFQQGSWRTLYWDLWENQIDQTDASAGTNRTSPSCFGWLPGVKNAPQTWGNCIRTFASDSTGNAEIFVKDTWGYMMELNLSNSLTIERHPGFYLSFITGYAPYPTFWLYNIWESFRQGHWVLYLTYCPVPMIGEVNQQNIPETSGISIIPNPCMDGCNIRFHLDHQESVCVQILHTSGQEIRRFPVFQGQKGPNEIHWDGFTSNGFRVSEGLYLVQLTKATGRVTTKVIVAGR